MEAADSLLLDSLLPRAKKRIMDLVEAAGVDVNPWKVKLDGTPAKSPPRNPDYCYEWGFGGELEPTVLCVWHRNLAVTSGSVVFKDSLREFALKLDVVGMDTRITQKLRDGARRQAKRARKFDSLVQRAFRQSRPVRVILLKGKHVKSAELDWDTSKVDLRLLDAEQWYVASYGDDDGNFELVRGLPATKILESEKSDTEPPQPSYVDQFSIPTPPEKQTAEVTVTARSTDVRRHVLARASGVCEYCKVQGFKTAAGSIYLETHHVIPLAENGPDIEWNVVAICPNDHRRAHYADDRDRMRSEMIELLIRSTPMARDALTALAENFRSNSTVAGS